MMPMATDLTIKLNESEKSGLMREVLNVATRNLFPKVTTTSPKNRPSALPTEATSPASLSTLTKTKRSSHQVSASHRAGVRAHSLASRRQGQPTGIRMPPLLLPREVRKKRSQSYRPSPREPNQT